MDAYPQCYCVQEQLPQSYHHLWNEFKVIPEDSCQCHWKDTKGDTSGRAKLVNTKVSDENCEFHPWISSFFYVNTQALCIQMSSVINSLKNLVNGYLVYNVLWVWAQFAFMLLCSQDILTVTNLIEQVFVICCCIGAITVRCSYVPVITAQSSPEDSKYLSASWTPSLLFMSLVISGILLFSIMLFCAVNYIPLSRAVLFLLVISNFIRLVCF